jgi:DNA invertase Pin-like site-specific DNA recombinase
MSSAETIALIYIRVSKAEMAKEGLSIPTQLATCRRYAVERGWTLGQHFEDQMSGRRVDRPGYTALLEEVRRLRRLGRGVAVIVARLDRFGRNLLESIRSRNELKAFGVPLHSIREGGELSDLQANLLSVVAQDESDRISARVRDVREELTGGGWWPVGRVAWGWRLRDATPQERGIGAPQRVLMEDPATGPAVRELFKRVADGLSVRQAAKWARGLDAAQRGEYTDESAVLHKARPLSFQRIRLLLRSPRYIAREPGPENEAPQQVVARQMGRWPALVSDHLWLAVQEQIGGHQRQPKQASGRYLLTGFLRCPKCRERGIDQRMSGLPYYYGDRGSRYMCSGAAQGGCIYSIVGHTLDASALRQIGSLVDVLVSRDPGLRVAVRAAWDRIRQPDDEGDLQRRREIREAERRLTEAQRRLQEAQYRLLDGTLSAQEYPALRDGLQAALDEAEGTLAKLRAFKPEPVLPPLDMVVQAAEGWGEIVAGTDIAAKRALLGDLVERIYPVNVAYGRYRAMIHWTPLGKALRQLRESVTAA